MNEPPPAVRDGWAEMIADMSTIGRLRLAAAMWLFRVTMWVSPFGLEDLMDLGRLWEEGKNADD